MRVFGSTKNVSINGNSSDAGFKLYVNGTSNITGQLKLGSTITNGTYTYTLPSATGTLALTSDIPSGAITGSGTTNYLPKFTGSSTIGNSAITDDGTTVTLVSRALSGTSATFSGNVIVGGSSPVYLKFNVQETSANRVAILYRGTQGADASMVTSYGTPYLSIGGQENKVNSIQSIGFGFTNGTSYTQPAEIGFQTTSLSGYTLGDLVFATRGATTNTVPTERMRLDAYGNLGLGVTPSAWSAITAIELGNGVSFSSYTAAAIPNGYITNNAFYNGSNWIYKVSSFPATIVTQTSGGNYAWNVAPSGTAGAAISFTQAMTLFSDGNLLLTNSTVTNAGYKLDVNGMTQVSNGAIIASGFANRTAGTGKALEIGMDGTQGLLQAFDRTASAYIPIYIASSAATFSSSVTATNGTFYNAAGGTIMNIYSDNTTTDNILLVRGNSGSTIGLAVKGSGNVGIGTTNPQRTLSIANGGSTVEIDAAGGTSGPIYFNYNRNTSTYLTPEYWALAHKFMVNGGTEAMCITSGGNVGIGTTSPSYKLQVGDLANTSAVYNDIFITGDRVNNDGYYARLIFGNSSQSGGSTASVRGERKTSNYGTELTFYTNTSGSAGDGTERMRITSGGVVQVASAGSLEVGYSAIQGSYKLDVNGTGRFSNRLYANSNITFSGYISPSSNVGYGVKSSNGTVLQEWYDGATYNYGTFVNTGAATFSSSVSCGDIFSIGQIQNNSLSGSGVRNVNATAAGELTVSTSDSSLKKNVENATYGLDVVMALRPVTYNWIPENKLGTQKELGFIAQEVQELIPEVIGTNYDGKLSLDYAKIVAVLTKAIQEQQVQIKELKSKINK
jgi:hypothetical protein